MNLDELRALSQRWIGTMEALGALAAALRVDAEGVAAPPDVARALAGVTGAMGLDVASLAALSRDDKLALAGSIRAFVAQTSDLVEHPERAPGWTNDDPLFLQSQGKMSMSIAAVVARLAPQLGDLEARLQRDGATFLDVGTGVGWLAVAMAKAFPALRVVGIDVFPPSLALARSNLASVGLADRIELREQDVTTLPDRERFDLVFLATPFLPKAVIPAALERTRDALRPGGWVLFGTFATVDDPLAVAAQELRVVRAGGHPWSDADAVAVMRSAGLVEVRAAERTWSAPVGFVVGRRAP